jgi:hypothetical protein
VEKNMEFNGAWISGHIEPFWNIEEIKNLKWFYKEFNDDLQIKIWNNLGFLYRPGLMVDIKNQNIATTDKLISIHENKLKNIGINYYCMRPGDNLPSHTDEYYTYKKIFNLYGQENKIIRIIYFLEDWNSGNYFEIDNTAMVNWKSGDYVAWKYKTPHIAANLGNKNRYTIQVTGTLK